MDHENLIAWAKGIAVTALIAGVGYMAVTQLGWTRTLGFLGFEITSTVRAPQTDCQRNPDLENEQVGDEVVLCISDRLWIKDFLAQCARRQEMDLVHIRRSGRLRGFPRCTAREQRRARALRQETIPRDVRVTEFIGG